MMGGKEQICLNVMKEADMQAERSSVAIRKHTVQHSISSEMGHKHYLSIAG